MRATSNNTTAAAGGDSPGEYGGDGFPDGDGEVMEYRKSPVDCICPKCGRHHKMLIHWIGRGTPRKFCSNCRDSS